MLLTNMVQSEALNLYDQYMGSMPYDHPFPTFFENLSTEPTVSLRRMRRFLKVKMKMSKCVFELKNLLVSRMLLTGKIIFQGQIG